VDYDRNNDQPNSARELKRLAEAPLRRPGLVLVPLVVLLVGAVALSFVLPPRYSSSTLILVAPESMPDSFVQQVSTEKVARRLQTLRQEVQSRTRLEMVARELDPYGMVGREPLIRTIEKMRDAITISVKGNDAFSIEFEHRDPKMAMLVADRLTTLFMDEVVGARARQVSVAYQFIEDQLEEARRALEEKEAALAQYKERYMGMLPEQVNSNLATLQRLQLEHQTVSEGLRKATDTLVFLESGMTTTADGRRGTAGAEAAPTDSLAGLRAYRAQLLARYTPEHPDVKALDARIEALEKAEAKARGATPAEVAEDPAAAQARLRNLEARRDVEAQRRKLAEVEEQIKKFQSRVEAAPRREQDILSLTRDYEKLKDNYASLLSKKMEAEMAAKLEQQAKGQQFRVLDPAYLPDRPSFPKPSLFAMAGAVLGLLIGVGLAIGVDFLDPTIKDVDDLGAMLPYPVLAAIPYVPPKVQRRLAHAPDDTIPPRRGSAGHQDDSGAARLRRVSGDDSQGDDR